MINFELCIMPILFFNVIILAEHQAWETLNIVFTINICWRKKIIVLTSQNPSY